MHDSLGRTSGTIDALGYATFIARDHRGRETYTHRPNQPLAKPPAELVILSEREREDYLKVIRGQPQESDERSWVVYDSLDRPLFKIDGTGAVKEFRYGLFSSAELTIRYANRLDVNLLSPIPTTEDIKKLLVSNEEDHCTRTWHDAEGLPIAQLIKLDATHSRLIEWKYYHQGLIVHKQEYAEKIVAVDPWKADLETLRPKVSSYDINTYIYYNPNREIIATVNGENILTETRRDLRGDAVEIIQYYNPVSVAAIPQTLDQLRPSMHSEDWHTYQTFDGLHRVLERLHPNGRKERFRYLDSDSPVEHIEEDTLSRHARGVSCKTNALEEVTSHLLPDGVDYQFQSGNEERAWEIYAKQSELDAAGRVAFSSIRLSTDPTSTSIHKVFDYYDARDQVRFHVGAVGEVTEYTYDARGNKTSERRYYNAVSEDKLNELEGGPLTIEIQQYFEMELRHAQKDRTAKHYYDALKNCIATQRPNSQWIFYEYNAFGNQTHIAKQLTSTEWRVTVKHYNATNKENEVKQYAVTTKEPYNFLEKHGSTGGQAHFFKLFQNALQRDNASTISNDNEFEITAERLLHHSTLDAFDRPSSVENGNGVVTQQAFDRAHRLKSKTCQERWLEGYEYDAHDRVTAESNGIQPGWIARIHHTGTRAIDMLYFDENNQALPYTATQQFDAFGQIISDQLGTSKNTADHDAYGNVLSKITASGDRTDHQYLVGGAHEQTLEPSGFIIRSLKDSAYRDLGTEILAADGGDYEHTKENRVPDAFGDVLSESHEDLSASLPEGRLIYVDWAHEYDPNSQRTATTTDPAGAKRLERINRRLDGAAEREEIIDSTDLIFFEAARVHDYKTDGFGRSIATVIDPIPSDPTARMRKQEKYLQLTTNQAFDKGDIPIATTDANGNTSYTILAGHGLSKLIVDPQGRATYKENDTTGHLILERRLSRRLTPDEVKNIRELSYKKDLAKVLEDNQYYQGNDLIKQWLYDRAGALRYEISAGGKVTEHFYNQGTQKIRTIRYAERVTVNRNHPHTLDTIKKSSKANPQKDESTYFIVNALGQPSYEIDALGYLTYQVFDKYGKLREKTRYAERLSADVDPATVTFEQAQQYANLRESNPKNRTELTFYSVRTNAQKERLQRYVVDSQGLVTQYQYDIRGNRIREILYKDPGNIADLRKFSFAQIAQWCRDYDNTSKPKTINEIQYDALNRKITAINAEGARDVYENDILGNPLKHIDKGGNTWEGDFDRAGRQTARRQPLRDVTHVAYDETQKEYATSRNKVAIATTRTPDNLGQIIKTEEGIGQPDHRAYTHSFNASREKQSDTIHDVAIYQPEKDLEPQSAADRTTFEEITDLKDENIYDSFGRPTVKIHRDGLRSYQIFGEDHDQSNNKPEVLFTIATDGAVVGNTHDAFGNVITSTLYFEKIVIEPTEYPYGLTYSQMLKLISPNPDKDRAITSSFDLLQRKITETLPEAIYANANNPKTPENDQRFYKLAVHKQWVYGAFSEPTAEVQTTNPYAKSQPSILHFYDNDGREIANISKLGYLTECRYDSDGNKTYQIEYANPCTQFDINGYIPPARSPEDREWLYDYDTLGQQIATTELNATYRTLKANTDLMQPPELSEKKTGHRVHRTFYDALGNPIIKVKYILDPITNQPGEILRLDISLHSPISKVIANIYSPRTRYYRKEVDGKYEYEYRQLIPVVTYEHDSHGRTVFERGYANSLNQEAYAQFQANVLNVLLQSPNDSSQRDVLIKQAYALATPEILENMKDEERDRKTFHEYDAVNNVIAEQGPAGLRQLSSYTAIPEQVAKLWWWDKVWDERLRDRLQKPDLKDQSWVILSKYDEAGLQIRLERWTGVEPNVEHHVERYAFNAFRERTHRSDDDEEWKEIWRHNKVGQVEWTNSGDGVGKRLFYQPESQEPSVVMTSPSIDLSPERASEDIRYLMNQPAASRRELWTGYDNEGRPTQREYPAYSTVKSSPNIALRAGKQAGTNQSTFGDYAIVWPRPANKGTHTKLFVRVHSTDPNAKWTELPVLENDDYMGATTTHMITDDYDYMIELYHGSETEPYSTSGGRIVIVTPNNTSSKNLVAFVDPELSATAIQITGNTLDPKMGDLTGIRVFKKNDDKPYFIAVTKDEMRNNYYIAEARDLPRGVYKGVGRADVTEPIGPPIYPDDPLTLYHKGQLHDAPFITEVTAKTQLRMDVEVTDRNDWVPQPDDPEYLPCYDPNDPHANHDERGCEKPFVGNEEGHSRQYTHWATIELDTEGIPEFPDGTVFASVKLRCSSGRTIWVPAHAFPTRELGKKATFTLKLKIDEFINPDPGTTPEDDWGGNPYPPEAILDHPTEVDQVILEVSTSLITVNERVAKKAEGEMLPLFHKAPTMDGRKASNKAGSTFPQRTLFIPNSKVVHSDNVYENPIAVQVTSSNEPLITLGVSALTTLPSSGYQTVDLSTLGEIGTVAPKQLIVQPVAPRPMKEAYPAPVEQQFWVDTRPLNSSQGASEPFESSSLSNTYWSNLYVEYHTLTNGGFFDLQIRISDIAIRAAGLPFNTLDNLLAQGKAKVQVFDTAGYPFTLVYSGKNEQGEVLFTSQTSPSIRIIPGEIRISITYGNINYLVYSGVGDSQTYYHVSYPNRNYIPHESLYGFTTTQPLDEVKVLEARSIHDDKMIDRLPIKEPLESNHTHYWVSIPEAVELPASYLIPLGQAPVPNTLLQSYESDLQVEMRISSNIYYIDVTPIELPEPYLSALKTKGECELKVQGIINNENKVFFGELSSSSGGKLIFKLNGVSWSGTMPFLITNIQLSHHFHKSPQAEEYVPNSKLSHLIYNSTGDKHYYGSAYPQYNKDFKHKTHFIFGLARPPAEEVLAVQVVNSETGEHISQAPILPAVDKETYTQHYVVFEDLDKSQNYHFQLVGPSEVQPYPILDTEFSLLGQKLEKLTLAESRWDLDAKITSQMYWTRYDESWMDWWDGDKYRWEGQNTIEVDFPHTPDLQGGELEFTIDYELVSKNNQKEKFTKIESFQYDGSKRTFNLYSPYTSSKNAPAQLDNISHIKVCRIVKGEKVVVYDSDIVEKGRQHLLYLTPLPENTKSLEFQYRAKESGTTGLWQKLPLQVVPGAAYLDSDTVPIGHYEYQLRAYDMYDQIVDLADMSQKEVGADGWARGDFFVTRGQGVVVPEPDLSTDTIKPKEAFQHDRWGNETQFTNVRDATFNRKFNRDNQLETEEGPGITIMEPEEHLTVPPPSPVKYATKIIENETQLTSLPETLVRIFQPSINAQFTSPKLIRKGNANQNSGLLKVKVDGLTDLPFTSYQLEIKWITKDKKQGGKLFKWSAQKGNDATYQEFCQIPLNIIGNEFDIPNGTLLWTLEGYVGNESYTLIQNTPVTHYARIESQVGKGQPIVHEPLISAAPRIALFTQNFTADSERSAKGVPPNLIRENVHPSMESFYDANGAQIGMQKPSGAQYLTVVDVEEQPLVEYAPGYLKKIDEPDVFGDVKKTIDAQGHATEFEHTVGGHLTQIIHPDNTAEHQLRNAQGQLLRHTDAAGKARYSQPGLDDRAVVDRDSDDVILVYTYQPQTGELIKTGYADGTSNEVQRNIWGVEIGGKDRGNVVYIVEHDLAQQPTMRVSHVKDAEHGYDDTGKPVPGQEIAYAYHTDGKLFQLLDRVRNVLIETHPEIGGETERRRVFTEHGITQDLVLSKRNLLGWVGEQSDVCFVVMNYYDINGNKRAMQINNCFNPETGESLPNEDQEQFFTFAPDDSVVTARASRGPDGKLSWNEKNHNTSVAETIKGNRFSLTFYRRYPEKVGKYVTENYLYTPNGVLSEIYRSDDTWKKYKHDVVGRVRGEESFDFHGDDDYASMRDVTVALSDGGRARVITEVADGRETTIDQDLENSYALDGTLKHAEITGDGHKNEIIRTHTYFDSPQESTVTNIQTIDGTDPTEAVGTTYYGSNGELLKFENNKDTSARKEFVANFMRQVHSVKERGAIEEEKSKRVVYSFLDDKGREIARFERDKDRKDWPEEGLWTFDMSNRPSTVVNPQTQPMMQTVTEGATLIELAQGNEEWLWLLEEANPGLSPSTPLPAGTQVKIPYGQTSSRLNAEQSSWSQDVTSMVGNTIPQAPLPYIPHPDTEGGFKNYLPVIVGVAVTIAVYKLLVYATGGGGKAGISLAKTAGSAAMTALSFAAGNTAAQLTADEMGMLPGGVRWNQVWNAAGLGAALGAAHSIITLPTMEKLGLTRNEAVNAASAAELSGTWLESAQVRQIVASIQKAAVTQATLAAYNGTADMRTIVSTVLTAGVTDSLLVQAGFDGKGNGIFDSNTLNVTIDVLVGAFANAGLATLMTGQPLNAQQVAAVSAGRIAAEVALGGLDVSEALARSEVEGQPTAQLKQELGLGTDESFLLDQNQIKAAQAGSHRARAPGQAIPKLSNEGGYGQSVEDAVLEPISAVKPTRREQKLLTRQYENSLRDAQFKKGNEGHTAQMSVSEELPLYVYPQLPSRLSSSYADDRMYEGIFNSAGTRAGPGRLGSGLSFWDSESLSLGTEAPYPYEGVLSDNNVWGRKQNAKLSSSANGWSAPDEIELPKMDVLTVVDSGLYDMHARAGSVANSNAFKGRMVGDAFEYASGTLKGASKVAGAAGNIVAVFDANDFYKDGEYYKGNEAIARAIGGTVGGSLAVGVCGWTGVGVVPGVLWTCGVAGSWMGDLAGAQVYPYIHPVVKWTHEQYADSLASIASPSQAHIEFLENQRIILPPDVGSTPPAPASLNWLYR
ncbi:MAG: hypothetical protein ACHP9Y_00135 [Gammaproteobacteria bacterium]